MEISFSLSASICFSKSGTKLPGPAQLQVATVGGRARISRKSPRAIAAKSSLPSSTTRTNAVELLLDGLVVLELSGLDQNVSRMYLRHHRLADAAAHFIQAEDVETAGRADGLRTSRPGFILGMFSARMDGSCEPRRQPSEPPSMLVLLSE